MDSITTTSTQFYQCKYGRVSLLTADNYSEWSTTLTNFLRADRTWKIVQGLEVAPTPPNPREPSSSSRTARGSRRAQESSSEPETDLEKEYEEKIEEFESKAAKACSMIISSVSPSFQQFIFTLTDPARI
jgi:hypothetical protein